MTNLIPFPLNDVHAWIAAKAGICPFCKGGSQLKPDHRKVYDIRCMECGSQFDMHSGEIALRLERVF